MSIRPEFVIERQGRKAVLYAGLLDLAHDQGLKRIQTRLLQVPDETNGHVAIAHAEIETAKGVFSGIGDASPLNVARPMVTAIIRMAETRAKARALRDAVNIGEVALEELPDDDEPPAQRQPSTIQDRAARQSAAVGRVNGNGRQSAPAAPPPAPTVTSALRVLYDQTKALGKDKAWLEALAQRNFGALPSKLTVPQIQELGRQLDAAAAAHQHVYGAPATADPEAELFPAAT